MNKSYLVIAFLIGFTVLLSVFRVFAYNRLSTSGVFVGKIEDEISLYKTQNAILSEKLLASSSLSYISVKALELGFVDGYSSLMVFETSKSLAMNQ